MNLIRHHLLTVIILIVLTTGCGDLLVDPDPTADPATVLQILWREFDRYYPFFLEKNVEWDSMYTAIGSRINEKTDDDSLYALLSKMLNSLRDGHVNLYTPMGTSRYTGWYDQFPVNFNYNIILNRYLGSGARSAAHGNLLYGRIGSIGYVHIRTFAGNEKWAYDIDRVIEELHDTDGIIVDIRHNGGGSTRNANLIASRFADRQRIYSYIQYRNGPHHSDFTELKALRIGPSGPRQYTNPVAVLTNRSTFSAAEDFTLSMKKFPNVIHIGDTTGGGLGNPIFRELPNGWRYRLPVWRQFPPSMEMLEGIGIAPDIPVSITSSDAARMLDSIVEKALEELRSLN